MWGEWRTIPASLSLGAHDLCGLLCWGGLKNAGRTGVPALQGLIWSLFRLLQACMLVQWLSAHSKRELHSSVCVEFAASPVFVQVFSQSSGFSCYQKYPQLTLLVLARHTPEKELYFLVTGTFTHTKKIPLWKKVMDASACFYLWPPPLGAVRTCETQMWKEEEANNHNTSVEVAVHKTEAVRF